MPHITWEAGAAALVALATLITSIAGWRKISHEMKPNHGGSLRDALNRIEASQRETRKDIGGLRSEVRHLHTEASRLAAVDQDDRRYEREAHTSLETRITALEHHLHNRKDHHD